MGGQVFGARAWCMALLLAAVGGVAQAEPIPETVLDDFSRECRSSCNEQPDNNPDFCTLYCGCTRTKISEALTFEDYRVADAASRRSQYPPPRLKELIQAIVDSCNESSN